MNQFESASQEALKRKETKSRKLITLFSQLDPFLNSIQFQSLQITKPMCF